jgi:hypothetical protein
MFGCGGRAMFGCSAMEVVGCSASFLDSHVQNPTGREYPTSLVGYSGITLRLDALLFQCTIIFSGIEISLAKSIPEKVKGNYLARSIPENLIVHCYARLLPIRFFA